MLEFTKSRHRTVSYSKSVKILCLYSVRATEIVFAYTFAMIQEQMWYFFVAYLVLCTAIENSNEGLLNMVLAFLNALQQFKI